MTATIPTMALPQVRIRPQRQITMDEIMAPSELSLAILEHPEKPDWRWLEAIRIQRNIGTPDDIIVRRSHDAFLIQCLLPFKYEYDKLSSEDPTHCDDIIQEKYPHLYWARNTHMESGHVRYFMEAAICAGMTSYEIARALSVSTVKVEAYELTYFDVRNQLDNWHWMHLNVFNPAFNQDTRLFVENSLWKLFGWKNAGGRGVLESMMFIGRPAREKMNEEIGRIAKSRLYEAALEALVKRKPDSFNQNFIVDQFLKDLEIDIKAKEQETGGGSESLKAMQTFFAAIASNVEPCRVADATTVKELGDPAEQAFIQRRKALAVIDVPKKEAEE